MSAAGTGAAIEVVYREAHCLDARCWDDWLALYREDAVFWVPAWVDDATPVDDPATQVSLIYCAARAALEDRVWRVRSGLSAASSLLPRTTHLVTATLATVVEADAVELRSNWSCHLFDARTGAQHVHFGRYEHRLVRDSDGWKIAAKKIVLMNDRIRTMIDFYCV
jgi:benzoate/toluate 1,2-dioxygenase beta subunit/2,4,5-trichlorophenoxyacetic acid oxygenase 2